METYLSSSHYLLLFLHAGRRLHLLKLLCIVLFVFACIANSYAQSATSTNTTAASKKMTIADYEKRIKFYRYYKVDSALYFADLALRLAHQQQDANGEGLILVQLGMIDDNNGEFDKSQEKYEQALDNFTRLNQRKGMATANIRLGTVYGRNGSHDKAIRCFFEALKISESIADKYGIMEAYYSVSWSYLDQKNYDMALQYLNMADTVNHQLPFSNISLNILNNYGSLYRDKGQFDLAKTYLEKGITQSNAIEYQGLNITLVSSLASVYAKEGMIDKAVSLQKEALARSRAIGNYLRESNTLFALSRTLAKDKPLEAIGYLQQAIELSKERGLYNQEIRYLKVITPLYEAQGNYKDAYLYKKRENLLSDSFYYQKLSRNINTLRAEYDLHKSNAKVKELDLQNSQRQLELKNSKNIRQFAFAGIVLLLFISGLLYYQYRTKIRTNKEISQKNEALESLVVEKEWLLKEVNHRVKNNLQVVISLLNTQMAFLENPEAIAAIKESTQRMHAMSLIHQKLYEGDNTSLVNMKKFIGELTDYLHDSFNSNKPIRFITDIEANKLDIAQAIPIGLILNEAITNSIKYAFVNMERGEIMVTMKNIKGNTVLDISDNGPGLPAGFDIAKSKSMGMQLMNALVKQINGKMTVSNNKGLHLSIAFEHVKGAESPTMAKL